MSDTHTLWIAASLCHGLGHVGLRAAWTARRDIRAVWHDLPLSPTQRQTVLDQAAAHLAAAHRVGAHLLTRDQAGFPPLLATCLNTPSFLYYRGDPGLLRAPGIAVVGGRKHDDYGTAATIELVHGLVAAGFVIISGMAAGIDSVAHTAALDAGGRTIAVWGTGIDRLSPSTNGALARRIIDGGSLVVTSFHPGTPGAGYTFPERNKTIAGLAALTLVVQAEEGSGALITAGHAQAYGRPVAAVPGSIFASGSRGPHGLILGGALPAFDATAIVEKLGRQVPPPPQPSSAPMDPFLLFLQSGPMHIDDLVRVSGRSAAEVAATLTTHELEGRIVLAGSSTYRLA